ncbi:CRAL/TRIO domain-containing protein [Operophtera brumata]|uniref:CRAL/TRIO domain-containing protein n=1 Tax=Operophtera brumata TaxID=104452 RepID=A0A0L7KTI1_OPEBR|nr:CRAL/TRIO domain-containing protein [Operophtera brumata]
MPLNKDKLCAFARQNSLQPTELFHPDTLTYIRRQYNLDNPGEMDRAIDILEEWLKKQNHFTGSSPACLNFF